MRGKLRHNLKKVVAILDDGELQFIVPVGNGSNEQLQEVVHGWIIFGTFESKQFTAHPLVTLDWDHEENSPIVGPLPSSWKASGFFRELESGNNGEPRFIGFD